ncbi:DUF6877 family protein [Carnobacterium gallinarum]|uniref:DUF6877 family protein n=1 Tax=Carnobacterium gallinarum TaxID=2749 RepID=UPI000557A755|nr:DUF6877 family protein [Carnobacterium gallinarum]
MGLDEIMAEIDTLVSMYDFPISVLQDVEKRLLDYREVNYAKQQLRYLTNLISAGLVERSGKHGVN